MATLENMLFLCYIFNGSILLDLMILSTETGMSGTDTKTNSTSKSITSVLRLLLLRLTILSILRNLMKTIQFLKNGSMLPVL